MAHVFTLLESMATPMAPTFTMAAPSVVIANPPLEVSTTFNVQAINIFRTHSIKIHGGHKVEDMADVHNASTSKAFDVGMNMNNNDVNGRTSIELTFDVCNEVVQVPPIVVNQKNGHVLRHRSNTLLSRAHGRGLTQKEEVLCTED